MEYTGERLIPKNDKAGNVEQHELIYSKSLNIIKDTDIVLDCACGVGWGTYKLSKKAKHITGVDICQEAIDYANINYPGDNINYSQGDILNLPFKDGIFDVFNCIETFEHVPHHDIIKLIEEAYRVLKPNGLFLMSCPSGDFYDYHPLTPEQYRGFHKWHYKKDELIVLLSPYFSFVIDKYIEGGYYLHCTRR